MTSEIRSACVFIAVASLAATAVLAGDPVYPSSHPQACTFKAWETTASCKTEKYYSYAGDEQGCRRWGGCVERNSPNLYKTAEECAKACDAPSLDRDKLGPQMASDEARETQRKGKDETEDADEEKKEAKGGKKAKDSKDGKKKAKDSKDEKKKAKDSKDAKKKSKDAKDDKKKAKDEKKKGKEAKDEKKEKKKDDKEG